MVKISEHMISIVTAFLLFISNGLCETQNGLYSEESWFPIPIEECHQSCISKVHLKPRKNIIYYYLFFKFFKQF